MTPQELQHLSIADIDLILQDQTDLYSPEELRELKHRKQLLVELEQHNLPDIACPKCDGINPALATHCKFCNHRFKEWERKPKPKDDFPSSDEDDRIHIPIFRILGGTLFSIIGAASTIYGCKINKLADSLSQYEFNLVMREYGTDVIGYTYAFIILGILGIVLGLLLLASALFNRE